MAEASVSRSATSQSTTSRNSVKENNLKLGKMGPIDKIFPLYDQMMQKTKLPSWLFTLTIIYLMTDLISISLWIFTPIFSKVTGKWKIFYEWVLKVVSFQNPLDYTHTDLTLPIMFISIAAFTMLWIFAMIQINTKFYQIPVILLYISSFLIDILTPLLIVPCSYSVNHGIVSRKYLKSNNFIIEIILSTISFLFYLFLFIITTFLKSRSVVLTNILFPLFDHTSVSLWISCMSSFNIITSIFEYFNDWIYCIGAAIHICILGYIFYRLMFIPFYDVWRNGNSFSYIFGSFVLDINFYVLYFTDNLTYNYTFFIGLGAVFAAFFFSTIIFNKQIASIKNKLTYNDEITNVRDYFDELGIGKNSLVAMKYIVVGLVTNSDYFIDGSLTDYILEKPGMDHAISILLQIVTFFPAESRKMNVLYKQIISKRKPGIIDRFLIYQVFRIKSRRLMSDTRETLETYNKLKLKNEECKSIINTFWSNPNLSTHYLPSLRILLTDVNDYFRATIASNPNNLRIRNEYANFLAECKCDFNEAIKQKIISDSIADGINFNTDVSFRSVVNKFPNYLKQKIYDFKGNRILKHQTNGEKSSNSSHSLGNTLSSSLSVDVERQEMICKKILRDSKVRLALNNSITSMRPFEGNLIILLMVINLIVILTLFIGCYIFFLTELSWRKTSHSDIGSAGYTIFYNMMTNVYTLVVFAVMAGRFDGDESVLGDLSMDTKIFPPVVPTTISFPAQLLYCIEKSRSYLNTLLNNMATIGLTDNPAEIVPHLLKTQDSFIVCADASPDFKIPASLASQFVTIDYLQNAITGDINDGKYIPNIYKNNDFCQIAANLQPIAESAQDTFMTILNYNIDKADPSKKDFLIWIIVGSILIVLLVIVPMMCTIASDLKFELGLVKILTNLPKEVKDDAQKPLMLEDENSSSITANSSLKITKVTLLAPILYVLVALAIIAVYVEFCYNGINTNNDLSNILTWYTYSVKRISLAAQVGSNVVHLILLNGSLEQKVLNITKTHDSAKKDLDKLLESNSILLYGGKGVKPSLGFDDEFDTIQIKSQCELEEDPQTSHEMYACGSITTLLQAFKNTVNDVLQNPEMFNGNFKSAEAVNLIHLLRSHIYPSVAAASTRLEQMMEHYFNAGMRNASIDFACGMILLFVITIIPIYIRHAILEGYKVIMMFVQHLPPQTIANNPEILDAITRKRKSAKHEKMPISKSIVYDANECIIITNASNIIEIVNKSVTENIGLTPDQMLGQEFANFVSASDQTKIKQQIDQMLNGQASTFWQDHISLIDDKTQSIPFAITMIGMKDNENSSSINSIVFILTNETEEIEKRKEAEQAKAKSEKLLYQILPKDIVVRLNRGETDISFTIPSATIFFIDIVKFSNYAALLTPTEIMSNLSLVFATFDGIVAKYSTITKIKLIGDVYMAAAGLFMDEGEEPSKHAEEAVKCCIECSKSLEDINMKLSASLEVRIGCNSGGPLIGGVLGTDKPTFDIIGDPINVAARLQSTDIPGNVQISGETKALIENLDFVIEERGQVYLKGKGDRTTYFVKLPQKNQESSFMMNLDSTH